jgi:hypothetical protein
MAEQQPRRLPLAELSQGATVAGGDFSQEVIVGA